MSTSKGFLGVVNAGLRKGGAVVVRFIWEVENIEEGCEGVAGACFELDGVDCILVRGLLRPRAPPKILVDAWGSGLDDMTR